MSTEKRPATFRTCANGHTYSKSTDCPTCPECEAARKPSNGFMAQLSAPARRALEREGLTRLSDVAKRSKREILGLHGVGPSTMPKLERALVEAGLAFKP